MIQIYSHGTTTVALAPIVAAPGMSRRCAERAAVDAILERLVPGASLGHTAAGAPVLEGSRLHISISHSARTAAVAIDPARRIGIDIEGLGRGRQIERVASRVLSAGELERYAGRLIEAWTLKEALYKISDDPGVDWRASLPIPPALPARLIHTGRAGDSWLSLVARPV